MADTIALYKAPSGLTVTLEVRHADTNALVGSYAMTEDAGTGWYTAIVSDALVGVFRCTLKVGSNVLENGWINLADDAEIHEIVGSRAEAEGATNANVLAVKAVTDKLDTGLTEDGEGGYQGTAKFLELAPSGGDNVVYPLVFAGARNTSAGVLSVYTFETHAVTIPVLDRSKNPIDLSGLTLSVHFETLCHKDVAVVNNLEATGDDHNLISFALPTALTAKADTYEMAIRDQTGKIRLKALAEVQYAAKYDNP